MGRDVPGIAGRGTAVHRPIHIVGWLVPLVPGLCSLPPVRSPGAEWWVTPAGLSGRPNKGPPPFLPFFIQPKPSVTCSLSCIPYGWPPLIWEGLLRHYDKTPAGEEAWVQPHPVERPQGAWMGLRVGSCMFRLLGKHTISWAFGFSVNGLFGTKSP